MAKEELHHCPRCGAPAKIRTYDTYFAIECKKKCGVTTQHYPYNNDIIDCEAKLLAMEEWNNFTFDDFRK